LSSADFVERAAADVVASTRDRHRELQEQQTRLVEILQDLKS
jgi:hypothetical protein